MWLISLFNILGYPVIHRHPMPWQPLQRPCKTNHPHGLRHNHRRYVSWVEDLVIRTALQMHHENTVPCFPNFPLLHVRFWRDSQFRSLPRVSDLAASFIHSCIIYRWTSMRKEIAPISICCNSNEDLSECSWIILATSRNTIAWLGIKPSLHNASIPLCGVYFNQ